MRSEDTPRDYLNKVNDPCLIPMFQEITELFLKGDIHYLVYKRLLGKLKDLDTVVPQEKEREELPQKINHFFLDQGCTHAFRLNDSVVGLSSRKRMLILIKLSQFAENSLLYSADIKKTKLSEREYSLLTHLVDSFPKEIQLDSLVQKIWNGFTSKSSIYVYIGRLRTKISLLELPAEQIITSQSKTVCINVDYLFSLK